TRENSSRFPAASRWCTARIETTRSDGPGGSSSSRRGSGRSACGSRCRAGGSSGSLAAMPPRPASGWSGRTRGAVSPAPGRPGRPAAATVPGRRAPRTARSTLASATLQIPGRTPANTAMTAATLALLSGGRFLLGLGTSGPQVVEGWHGQPCGKPLGKTREYVEIVRAALRRQVVEHNGEHYRIPWDGPGATGLGKPLKLMLRPLRAEIPIHLAALGPKNVALAAEIGDGWLPIFVAPERFDEAFGPSLAAAPVGFEIAATASVFVGDDVDALRDTLRPHVALYIG